MNFVNFSQLKELGHYYPQFFKSGNDLTSKSRHKIGPILLRSSYKTLSPPIPHDFTCRGHNAPWSE